ncbi:MAG: VWA domain-containing protein, partial [Candidatus Omnitrophota bacterium]|nr:VWA domain-containing protein [Candidatus Omnitrophota bacterium]
VKIGKGEGKDTSGLSPEELDDEARSIIEQKSKELADSLDGKMDRPDKADIEKYREATAKGKISNEDKEKARKALEEYRKKIGKLRELIDRVRSSERERKEAQTNYERVYEKISHLIEHLKGYLGNIFLKNTKATYTGYYRSGQRLDIRRLIEYEASFKTDDRLWLRRKLPSKKDYKFTLVIDESGSMGGERGGGERGERAIEALLLFMETLDLLEINFEIIGFSDAPSIHRKFNGKMSAPEKEDMIDEVSRYMGNGGTADADALKLGIDNMKEQSGERRVILVLTDGDGNINTTGMAMEDILKEAENKDIEVIGIGIGEGMEYVQKTYPYHVTVPDMDELPLEIAALLEHRILGEKIDRTKPAYFGLQSLDMIKNPAIGDSVIASEGKGDNLITKQENIMNAIHSMNLNLTPTVPQGKVLWHVIPEKIIPYPIRSRFIAIANEMNRIPRIREKIKVVTEKQDLNYIVSKLTNDSNNIVDAAVSKAEELEGLPNGVKALVFEGELGEFRQLEGILAALRALHRNDVRALIKLYELLTGDPFSGSEGDIIKNLNDPKSLAQFILFKLKPIERIRIQDLERLNDNLIKLIQSA